MAKRKGKRRKREEEEEEEEEEEREKEEVGGGGGGAVGGANGRPLLFFFGSCGPSNRCGRSVADQPLRRAVVTRAALVVCFVSAASSVVCARVCVSVCVCVRVCLWHRRHFAHPTKRTRRPVKDDAGVVFVCLFVFFRVRSIANPTATR